MVKATRATFEALSWEEGGYACRLGSISPDHWLYLNVRPEVLEAWGFPLAASCCGVGGCMLQALADQQTQGPGTGLAQDLKLKVHRDLA